ncbi:MAG TPA: glycosyltransferase family 1 protein [Streptosporangiaceae bacterium]|nr:glycosyltransferase family 1 protein [Streptosporangiaceae bacterium]
MTTAGAAPASRPAGPDARPVALVYGDIDLNLIDGSAVWLQSVVQALALAGCAVTLVLKAPVRTSRLLGPLLTADGVTVCQPQAEGLVPGAGPPGGVLGGRGPERAPRGLTPAQASAVLTALDERRRYDLIVLRGWRVVSRVTADGSFDGRIWAYLTDIPQSVPDLSDQRAAELGRVAEASAFLLCQTEELRSFLTGSIPAAAGKCVLLPPIVPPREEAGGPDPARPPDGRREGPLRLVYTGKFAPRWNTYEMTQLPGLLASRGVPAEVHLVGDKIHDDPADPGYAARMRAALGTPGEPRGGGVSWHGGQSRQRAMAIAAGCDIGLSWRHPSMDASLELSTKVLEFGLLGLPVILNRTAMHEDLLGADYPLFAATLADVADVAARAVADPAAARLAAARTSAAASRFTLDAAAGRLRGYLARAFPRPAVPARPGGGPLRVVVAGHDLKFFGYLMEYFRRVPGLEVRVDQWAGLGQHDPGSSAELARWADVVICEWCGPNAVWYSRHKRRGSRLLVRLHRFELSSGYANLVNIKAIDQVVCVSRHYARLSRQRTGWPAGKVTAIPNALDTDQLDRPKLPGARFNLGLVGIVPSRKRLDLALDVLAELRRQDDRYQLFIKSAMPWEHWWVWRKAAERDSYTEALRRIQRSPLLRDAVVFDEAGPDVPGWLRRVGFVLSTSDDESFHVAPAEGMASRAVPVVRHWPGAETTYQQEWIHRTPAEMAEAIADLPEDAWAAAGRRAREQAVAGFGLGPVRASWLELLTSDLPPAVPDPLYELLGTP